MTEPDQSAYDAAKRISFNLAHNRSKEPRQFEPGFISGDDIDDAYNPGQMFCGNWMDRPELPEGQEQTEENWLAWYFQMAVQESIHECLEWFQVDGKPWLCPHPINEKLAITAAVERFWEELVQIRNARIEREGE